MNAYRDADEDEDDWDDDEADYGDDPEDDEDESTVSCPSCRREILEDSPYGFGNAAFFGGYPPASFAYPVAASPVYVARPVAYGSTTPAYVARPAVRAPFNRAARLQRVLPTRSVTRPP